MLTRFLVSFTLGFAILLCTLWFLLGSRSPRPGDIDPSYILRTSVEPVLKLVLVEKYNTDEQRDLTITDESIIDQFVDALLDAKFEAVVRDQQAPIERSVDQYITIHYVGGESQRLALAMMHDGTHLLFDADHYVRFPGEDLRTILQTIHEQHDILEFYDM